jgi:hypothetical protein
MPATESADLDRFPPALIRGFGGRPTAHSVQYSYWQRCQYGPAVLKQMACVAQPYAKPPGQPPEGEAGAGL